MRLNTAVLFRGAGVVAAMLLTGSVLAGEGPRYTYVEAGYSRLDFDNLDNDGDFFNGGGSLAVHKNVHLFADYAAGSVDVSNNDVDVTNVQAGVGLNVPLSNTVDFIFDVAYLWTELEFGNNSVDDDGYGLRAGVRAMLTPKFELNGGGTYADYSDSDNDEDNTALYVGGVYNFTDMFAMTGGVSVGDNVTSYGVGVRLYFGDMAGVH